ncbi:hypothetical protein E2C01_042678 [Portunus trituberculatus]|uniref:Uncharacterized protein n=1 Tax=Portunus trituberculatus TaxID=210409 RepID=A0A5B7FQU7_PORTR|nr:hypothetical protein [Portunus trituberculatus]
MCCASSHTHAHGHTDTHAPPPSRKLRLLLVCSSRSSFFSSSVLAMQYAVAKTSLRSYVTRTLSLLCSFTPSLLRSVPPAG